MWAIILRFLWLDICLQTNNFLTDVFLPPGLFVVVSWIRWTLIITIAITILITITNNVLKTAKAKGDFRSVIIITSTISRLPCYVLFFVCWHPNINNKLSWAINSSAMITTISSSSSSSQSLFIDLSQAISSRVSFIIQNPILRSHQQQHRKTIPVCVNLRIFVFFIFVFHYWTHNSQQHRQTLQFHV